MNIDSPQKVLPMNVDEDVATLYRDGIVGKKGAFSRDWAEAMREDMMTAFWSAIQRPGGAVGRGPRRWYVEIHPEQFGVVLAHEEGDFFIREKSPFYGIFGPEIGKAHPVHVRCGPELLVELGQRQIRVVGVKQIDHQKERCGGVPGIQPFADGHSNLRGAAVWRLAGV